MADKNLGAADVVFLVDIAEETGASLDEVTRALESLTEQGLAQGEIADAQVQTENGDTRVETVYLLADDEDQWTMLERITSYTLAE